MEQPVLETPRLILRPFTLADAPGVQRLAGAFEVADTTLNVPHPYGAGVAAQWIGGQAELFTAGSNVTYAITLRDGGVLLGAISLMITAQHRRGEMGYWLGVPFWGRGCTTEAARALAEYGFGARGLHKITASHFIRNPASGRVMEKIGMMREGLLHGHVRKGDRWEDLVVYGLLAPATGASR